MKRLIEIVLGTREWPVKEVGNERKIDIATLQKYEDEVLVGLITFFLTGYYIERAYFDKETGGVYEHKLAVWMGFELSEGKYPPPQFQVGAYLLEGKGLVRRNRRREDFDILGIWPTSEGFRKYKYLRANGFAKLLIVIGEGSKSIVIGAVGAAMAIVVAYFLGLIGMKK
jgi:hypothetical protein